MYQSTYNLEDFDLEFNKRYNTLSRTKRSNGEYCKISITGSVKNLSGEDCVMCISILKLVTGEELCLSLILDSEHGYANPVKSDLLGERVGTLDLKQAISVLPEVFTDKVAAKTYLARNPDMLVSLLSNTLNTQLSVIQKQDKVISDLDWWVSAMYKESGVKIKKLFNNVLTHITNSGMMSELKKTLKGEE